MTKGEIFLNELNAEEAATRKCLERMKPELFDWKPHEKSMIMGYLSIIVADIPLWIAHIIEAGVVDFATFPKFSPKTSEELITHFNENMERARKALSGVSDESLQDMFYLKNGGIELMKDTKESSVSSSLNHWVHHRGQLTVYMRMNDIPVPSIYGPSADDRVF